MFEEIQVFHLEKTLNIIFECHRFISEFKLKKTHKVVGHPTISLGELMILQFTSHIFVGFTNRHGGFSMRC